jgi:hypothetical protein
MLVFFLAILLYLSEVLLYVYNLDYVDKNMNVHFDAFCFAWGGMRTVAHINEFFELGST